MLIWPLFGPFQKLISKTTIRCLTSSYWTLPEMGYDTGIKIYNCVTKNKVPLLLRNKNLATWYTCGPTVYDFTHIGHASCYIKLDIIQRILRNHFKIGLVTAMNITDIDDKIIKKASESNVGNFQDISKLYENEFWKDLSKLNVQEPDIKIRVTDNIPIIIEFIEKLIKNDQAYIGGDKSAYFRVNKCKSYGKLQNLNLNEIKITDSNKDADIDFALWKVQKEKNEPAWPVPWNSAYGRPGWHIECSALATKIFGNKIDFHAGGIDLKFPHHENEEVQSCCYHNIDQWVNYWLHTGHLNLKGQDQKMSKSLKNTISISELLENYTADEFRMACALSNYRNSMEYSDELMVLARTTLNRFKSFLSDCQAYLDGKKIIGSVDSNDFLEKLHQTNISIDLALKDDFDTSKCICYLGELTNSVSKIINSNEEIYTSSMLAEIAVVKKFVKDFLTTIGFDAKTVSANNVDDTNLKDLIDKIIKIRYNIRQLAIQTKNQNLFKICDEIRLVLKSKHIEIKDHTKGSSWSSN